MSKGIGRVQGSILDELRSLNVGAGVLVGERGGNARRAAYGLEHRGLVKLERMLIWGRWRLIVRLTRNPQRPNLTRPVCESPASPREQE